MTVKALILRLCVLPMTLAYQNGLHRSIRPDRCDKNTYVLNDCNWCRCESSFNFKCQSRNCGTVDMFGHFNDAIRELTIGMEGHGVWRSSETACEPGVQYTRSQILCVCTKTGNWPSPVCRDVFRILHTVEVTGESIPTRSKRCFPSKLHLVGCNVCLCPPNGYMDPNLCTKRLCTADDPAVKVSEGTVELEVEDNVVIKEYYVECNPDNSYKLGCKTCVCLRNNRLLCNECNDDTKIELKTTKDYCSDAKFGEIFNIHCNLCYCDSENSMICTTKRCLSNKDNQIANMPVIAQKMHEVDAPIDDHDCTPGTYYEKDCKQCSCVTSDEGQKVINCTIRKCDRSVNSLDRIKEDCVQDTFYELDCQICNCNVINGIKRQTCKVNPICINKEVFKETKSTNLKSLRGYCEPLHIYENDCNTCRCLSDGKTVKCTSRKCSSEPIYVDVLPLKSKSGENCPKGHSFKLDCNYCFCLSNGNAICTTVNCNKKHLN